MFTCETALPGVGESPVRVIWIQSANWSVSKRVLGAEVGEAFRVNAVTAGYPPRERGFSFAVLGKWPILG